jgi:hypothetical protein
METQTFTFASSSFVPIAIGFFGLGTGSMVLLDAGLELLFVKG